jgi:two-component system response regulator MprA
LGELGVGPGRAAERLAGMGEPHPYRPPNRDCDHPDVPMRVLIVEDEAAVREALRTALELEGYDVLVAADGETGLHAVEDQAPDAVVLDRMLPGADGLAVARRLRADHNPVPILMLTARGAVGDRVAGLDAGADDYLVKPFALEELFARLRALLRRHGDGGDALVFGDLSLDPGTREVRRGERAIELTRTEFNLLELFLRNPRQVLRRSLIYERVWGYDFGLDSHSLDVYIGYLRRKLEAESEPRLIRTVRGVGYALREP